MVSLGFANPNREEVEHQECDVTINVPPPPSRDLIAEANHRIANDLMMIAALVRRQSTSISAGHRPATAEEVLAVLREVEARIEIVGRLHRLLADGQQSGEVNLGIYLRDVAEMVVSSLGYAERSELSHTSSADCTVPAEQAILIGVIVGELVTNSLKYAHPTGIAGKISVGCRRTVEAMVLVEVEDNGIGLPEGFDPVTQGYLGLSLVRSLAHLFLKLRCLGPGVRPSVFERGRQSSMLLNAY